MHRTHERTAYRGWIRDEIFLFAVLASAVVFFALSHMRSAWASPGAHLVVATAVIVTGAMVAVLAGVRYSVETRRLDVLLAGGYIVAAATTLWYEVGPVLGGGPLGRAEAWAGVGGRLLAAAAIAAAPFVRGRTAGRRGAFVTVGGLVLALIAIWFGCRSLGASLPDLLPGPDRGHPYLLTVALALQALLSLVAVVGFGLRYRRSGEDLDRWLAFAATLALFAELQYVFTPLLSPDRVSLGDLLRVLSYSVLVVGVWRAIRESEFGRAVAEERARVAREIHDGLAQYLFAVSTQASLLEQGAAPEKVIPRLKEAAAAAQQEARFAVLALSSAGGTAPFDAALRRYVDFLTADGQLEVDVEIDDNVDLGPDEQIEVFRIVQEGLANVRRHAHARRARGGRRERRPRAAQHPREGRGDRRRVQALLAARARHSARGHAAGLGTAQLTSRAGRGST
jgi:signal transduction histidine kinase